MGISILLAACVPTSNRAMNISTETQPACQPSKIQKSKNEFLEIQGNMKSEGEMWALLFFETAHTNEDEKIVWRITEEGKEFHAQAQNENGKVILPIWGPEYHGGSNWERPGQEWGTGFNFPEPGCWTITVTLSVTKGEIALEVICLELGDSHVKSG
jgi:hypothetical protein